LLAETKIVGDVLYGLTGSWQVEHFPAKSSRIFTHHEFLSVESPAQFHQTDSEKPRAHQNLEKTQLDPGVPIFKIHVDRDFLQRLKVNGVAPGDHHECVVLPV